MKKLVEKHLITNITDTALLNRSFSRVDTVSMGHCSLFLKTIWTFLRWFYFYLLSILIFFMLQIQFCGFSFSFLSCTVQVKKKVNYCDRCTALTTHRHSQQGELRLSPGGQCVRPLPFSMHLSGTWWIKNLQPSKPKCTSLTTRPPH